jgi:hypothetical protein
MMSRSHVEAKMLKSIAILTALAASAPAFAQVPAPSPTPAAAPVKVNPLDKIICRTEETVGSRLSAKKVCMSLRDWKDQADDSRDAAEKIQQAQGVTLSN